MKKLTLIFLMAGLAFSSRGQMPYNNASPYEQAGELHNDIFNYVKDNLPGKGSEQTVVQAMDLYLKEMNSNVSASEVFNMPGYQETVRQFRAASDKEQFLMDEGGFTAHGAGYYSQLFKGLSNTDYETLYNAIVTVEEDINRDKTLNNQEKRVLLIACVIGRHSAYNGIVNTNGSSSDQKKIWVADALGAIEGGLAGAGTIGVITIGTAVIPAWITGALLGGAKGSIMAWLAGSE